MATHGARRTMWTRKAIGAALAAGAMIVAAPAGIAMADPTYGPSGVSDPAIADYQKRINDLVKQFSADVAAGRADQQQFTTQLTAANNKLIDAILADSPLIGAARSQ